MIQMTIAKHAVAFPSKVLARDGGKHIYNIQLAEAASAYVDNGWFVGKGDFIELDLYKAVAPTSFEGKVVGKANNGNFYVEVVTPGDALFVYQVPMIEETYSNTFKKESNYTNAPTLLSQQGYQQVQNSNGIYVFLNTDKFRFSNDIDITKIQYSNMLTF